jgi:hypothetical protein
MLYLGPQRPHALSSNNTNTSRSGATQQQPGQRESAHETRPQLPPRQKHGSARSGAARWTSPSRPPVKNAELTIWLGSRSIREGGENAGRFEWVGRAARRGGGSHWKLGRRRGVRDWCSSFVDSLPVTAWRISIPLSHSKLKSRPKFHARIGILMWRRH